MIEVAQDESREKDEYTLIPQAEPGERPLAGKGDPLVKITELERMRTSPPAGREVADNVIYVTDLERNMPAVDAFIAELNSEEAAAEVITWTFYIQDVEGGSLERMALAMATVLGVNPEDIEGLEDGGEWMQMRVPTLEINLGTVGPGGQ